MPWATAIQSPDMTGARILPTTLGMSSGMMTSGFLYQSAGQHTCSIKERIRNEATSNNSSKLISVRTMDNEGRSDDFWS
ncbi:hypothetical protein ACRALDRAFT_1059413 [Sodiomyces alcalophilus JCM 7366]|uniref:uncharacterized protein n=1 Tax=Sodiomyces alcalophilus JCM 7366 TaxID=591952 RepID=UPI0039B41974